MGPILGSARDRPFLKGLGWNLREGPKLGIGSGSMSRIEGPDDLLEHDFLTDMGPRSCASESYWAPFMCIWVIWGQIKCKTLNSI